MTDLEWLLDGSKSRCCPAFKYLWAVIDSCTKLEASSRLSLILKNGGSFYFLTTKNHKIFKFSDAINF